MNTNRNASLTFLRNLVLILISVSLLIFVVIATLSSLFGHSMWSWINALRFIIGGAIVFTICCYALLINIMLSKPKK